MDDERQIMRYLSWLDDLDQDFIFRDTENVLTVKMDQGELTGQSNVDNTLQYDPNVANFDYPNRTMPYNVNEPIMTGAMNTAQPNVVPDSYNYNNYLPNGSFYTDPSLSQPHIPSKPSEQQYCVDMNHTVHSENSFVNTSDPQLCIDTSANSTNLNMSQESNQYSLPNNVDIKNNFFHEEKLIMNDDYANNQISMNAIPQDVNIPVNNTFSQQITSHEEVYCGDPPQEPMNIDHTAVHEKPFVDAVQILNEVSTPTVIESPVEIPANNEVNTKIEPSAEVKAEVKHEEVDLDQEPSHTSASVEIAPTAAKDEESVTQTSSAENEKDSNSQPIENGVDKGNVEEEVEIQMCIRNGCSNQAVNNPEWEQEFCSNECVIMHCRNVFTAWVKTNEIAT